MHKNSIFSLSLLLVVALVLTACGGGAAEQGGLAEKKAQIAELKTQRKALDDQIDALKAEIEALDSTPVRASRTPVTTMVVQPTDYEHFVKVQGELEADQNVMVSPKMGGVVTSVRVKEGQRVSRGQLLATLDDAVMQRSLLELETQLELADTVYSRQKNLWAQKIGSEIQLLQAKTQKESLERRIATTQEQMEMTRIKAPISGTVDRAIAKVGEAGSPGFGAFNIVNLRDLSFKAELSESYIPYVKRGDRVKISIPSINKTIETKVSTVSKIINPVNRTVTVEVDIPSGEEYKANMVGEVSIRDVAKEDAIVIPMSLVQQLEDMEFVMVAERDANGKYFAKRTPIVTGSSYKGNVLVESGLNKGAMLISEGANGLPDGTEVVLTESK